MEWTMVTVIIALAGLGAAVIKPIVNLTQTITKLTVVVDKLQEDVSGLTDRNSDSHARLWAKSEEQDGRIEEHERRIGRLEEHGG